jgi:hypothetical protein
MSATGRRPWFIFSHHQPEIDNAPRDFTGPK